MFTRLKGAIFFVFIALISLGCEPGPQKISFSITAVDTNNLPVSGVYIYLSSYEAAWGATDGNGHFQGESVAKVGETISFRLEPPEGYTLIPSSDTSFQVTESDQPILVEYTGQFKPPNRDYLFMVEGKKGDQIFINNKDVDTLNENGRAIFLYPGAPGEDFIIQVGVHGYRGILSTSKEVYLITEEVQTTLKDPDLFIGPLQEVANNVPTNTEPVAITAPLALDIEEVNLETAEPLDLPSESSEREEIAFAKPKRKKQKAKRSSRSSRSVAAPVKSKPRKRRTSPQPRKRKKVEEDSFSTRSSSFTIDEPKNSAPPPKPAYVPPPRPRTPPPKSSSPPPKRYTTTKSSTYSSSPSSSTGDVLSALKRNKKSSPPASKPKKKAFVADPPAPAPSGVVASMSKKDVKAKLKEIEKRYERTNRLSAQDVSFLKMLNKKHGTSYNSGHRLLGSFYYGLNDIRRQRDSLEIAVKKGRYKHDPLVLLSLAQAYGHFKQYSRSIKYLRRAESKMGRLNGAGKANVYRTYAEYLRLLYVSQRARNPLQADTGLLDKAIQKWTNLKNLSGNGSRDGADARTQIAKLEKMKSESGGL